MFQLMINLRLRHLKIARNKRRSKRRRKHNSLLAMHHKYRIKRARFAK